MKKSLLIICMAVICLCFASGCGKTAKAVLKTVTVDLKSNKTEYAELYDNGKLMPTEPFSPDIDAVFTLENTDVISSGIENGKIRLKLNEEKTKELRDPEKAILRALCTNMNHDVSKVLVIEDQGIYFAYVKLNVNLHDPCIFYRYDAEKDSLKELYRWENRDLIGISLC